MKLAVFALKEISTQEQIDIKQIARLKLSNGEYLRMSIKPTKIFMTFTDSTLYQWDFISDSNGDSTVLSKLHENILGLAHNPVLSIVTFGHRRIYLVRENSVVLFCFGKEKIIYQSDSKIIAAELHKSSLVLLTDDFCLKCYNLTTTLTSTTIPEWSIGFPLLQRIEPNRSNLNEIRLIDVDSSTQFVLVKWSVEMGESNFRDYLFGSVVSKNICQVPIEIPCLSLFHDSLKQADVDSSTLQGRLLENLFQTSCAIETGTDYVEVIQSNSCFLFSARINLSPADVNSKAIDAYSLPSRIWESFDIMREMYFPSNFIGTENSTSSIPLGDITKELDKINSELIEYKKNVSTGSALKWKLQPKTRDGIENMLGEPGMRRRIGRVLSETVPTTLDEAKLIMSNNTASGLMSARYEKIWEEESKDKVIRERRLARERTLLNKSNFEASMNGSLIKTPSVCHTDVEMNTNNESSELDQSDDELTKEIFQPRTRIGHRRKKEKSSSVQNSQKSLISQPQPITSSTQVMIKSKESSNRQQTLSDINESLEDNLNDISVVAGGPNQNLVNVPNFEKKERKSIGSNGDEKLTQDSQMEANLEENSQKEKLKSGTILESRGYKST